MVYCLFIGIFIANGRHKRNDYLHNRRPQEGRRETYLLNLCLRVHRWRRRNNRTLWNNPRSILPILPSIYHGDGRRPIMNPNPACEQDCRFQMGMSSTTCAYYAPVYDKHGNNLNPDGNTTTTQIHCKVCGKSWIGSTKLGSTTYIEIPNK